MVLNKTKEEISRQLQMSIYKNHFILAHSAAISILDEMKENDSLMEVKAAQDPRNIFNINRGYQSIAKMVLDNFAIYNMAFMLLGVNHAEQLGRVYLNRKEMADQDPSDNVFYLLPHLENKNEDDPISIFSEFSKFLKEPEIIL